MYFGVGPFTRLLALLLVGAPVWAQPARLRIVLAPSPALDEVRGAFCARSVYATLSSSGGLPLEEVPNCGDAAKENAYMVLKNRVVEGF